MKPAADSIKVFQKRRKYLISQLKDNECIILFSAPVVFRQKDVAYPYRQDSYFYYLTKFEEPEAILILSKREEIMFVREKNSLEEMWSGCRFGTELAKKTFAIDECFDITQFADKVDLILESMNSIYRIRSINPQMDHLLDSVIATKKVSYGKIKKERHFVDARKLITPMRMVKSDYELQNMKQACTVSKQAHIDVMKATQAGVNERHLHGTFIRALMSQGSERESYTGIFASGENALTLHYVDNNQNCQEGDMILVDAGAEWEYYASDVTRTFPVNGKFSEEQKILYDGVLGVQKELIKIVKPGTSFAQIQNKYSELSYNFLIQSGILDQKIEKKDISSFLNHSFGHFLGLDVHDVNLLKEGEVAFVLEPNMVITIEPGMYIPKNRDSVKPAFRGIGIRIEDDIQVTAQGCTVLSEEIPKERKDIESIMLKS